LRYRRSFRHLACLALSMAFIGSASPVGAWGDLGHQIVCQIALQELNDKARAEVVRLIALDERFQSFTDACTWPDHPRKRAEEHFINVARTVQTITTPTCPAVPKCLFTAMAFDLNVLSTSHDDQAKLASLKFLGHWMGDIHQPLHVSFADDHGGGFIRESGPCVNNLHAVWDTCIIEKKLGTDPQTVARDLLDGLPDDTKASWVAVPSKAGPTSPSRSPVESPLATACGSARAASIRKAMKPTRKVRKRRSSWLTWRIWNCTPHSCATACSGRAFGSPTC
jgi:S1/P1 Nuclease